MSKDLEVGDKVKYLGHDEFKGTEFEGAEDGIFGIVKSIDLTTGDVMIEEPSGLQNWEHIDEVFNHWENRS